MTTAEQQVFEEETAAEAQLRAAAAAAAVAEADYAKAKADLDKAIRETRETLSRRRVATIAGLTPGRVQQIIDSEPTSPSSAPALTGDDLRRVRQQLGFSVSELSKHLQVNRATVHRAESADRVSSALAARYRRLLSEGVSSRLSELSKELTETRRKLDEMAPERKRPRTVYTS
jgi:DNA-binding transcriptional regulator YiaG